MDDDLSKRRLNLAKEKVSSAGMSDGGQRAWLSTHVDSYSDKGASTVIHVLEGTPPRCYLIEQASHGFVTILDMRGLPFGTVVDDIGPYGRGVKFIRLGKRRPKS